MALSRRGILAGAATGWLAGGAMLGAAETAAPATGQLTEETLGQLIQAIGLKPEKQQQRYDFAFTAVLDEQKWELSMSAVLSQDGQSVWVMAWLDECPKSAADVPRTALLRLLAENDKMGSGKFFAYIPTNRRFVLQRVVPNEDMTSAKLRLILQDIGTTVVETHPTWAVAGWSAGNSAAPGDEGAPTANSAPSGASSAAATKTATNESKFQTPVKK